MKKNFRKLIVLIFIVLISLITLSAFYFLTRKKETKIKTYGNIEIRQVDLSFQVSGNINNVLKEEGDYVKKGELIATLDDRDYRAEYKKALFQEQTAFYQAKDDFSKYKRNLPLCSDDTISKEECESLLNKKDYSIAKHKEDKANTEFQKNQLLYTKLYAPQDGIISTRAQEKGARVQAFQTIYVMNLFKPVWVRTYIKETDLGNVKYGQKALVMTDSIDSKTGKNKTYVGYVGYISPVSEFTPKTVQTEDLRADLMYRIRVYIDEVDEYLRQGMPVTIEIQPDIQKKKNNELH